MISLDKAKHFIKVATYMLMVVVPLVFSFSFFDSYGTPKYFFFYTFLCFCAPFAGYVIIIQKDTRRLFLSLIGICILCYGLSLLIATLASQSLSVSIKVLLETFGYFIAYGIWIVSLERKDIVFYIKSICYTGFFVSLYALLQHTGLDLPGVSELTQEGIKMRSLSSLGNPTFLAGYLVMVAPLYLYLFFNENLYVTKDFRKKSAFSITLKSLLYPVMWIICAVAIFLTYTRGSWIAFFLSHIMLFILVVKELWKYNKKYIMSFFIMLTLVIAIVIVYDRMKDQRYEWFTLSNRLATLKNIDVIYSSRLYAWKAACEIFRDHPVVGTGLGTFPYAYLQYRYVEPADKRSANQYMNSCHNYFLELTSSCGISGVLTFCALIVAALYCTTKLIYNEIKTERLKWMCILSSIIAYLIHIVFLFPTISYEVLWWFLLSIITVEYKYHFPGVQIQEEQNKKGTKKRLKKTLLINLTFSQLALVFLILLISLFIFIVTIQSTLADCYLNKALRVGSTGNFSTAIAFFNTAITNQSENPSLYLYKARYLENSLHTAGMNKEMTDEVINLYKKSAKLNPLDPYVWVNMGRFYQLLSEQGDKSFISNAEEAYSKAITLDPYNFLNYNYIATLYTMAGENEKALQNFNKSLSLYDKSELVHYNLGVFFWRQKNIILSKNHVERALQINPNYKKAKELLQIIECDKQED